MADLRRVVLTIEDAVRAAVTDLGRSGLSRQGIPVNGASDQHSARVANILAGNLPADPLIEITAGTLAIRCRHPVLIAVSGAPARVAVGGRQARQWEPVCVAAGELVTVTGLRDGLRGYLAVNGLLAADQVLGSCAPDTLLGIGADLRPGAALEVDTGYLPFRHPAFDVPLFRFDPPVPRMGEPWTVEVTAGPDLDEFPGGFDQLLSAGYLVGADSNHVGLRLSGPVPARARGGELLSRGVPIGAVEVPPSDQLLVLLRGRPVTAGYPVIAVATRTARSVLGQVRPGQRVRFAARTVDQAVAGYRRGEAALHTLEDRVQAAYAALGVHSRAARPAPRAPAPDPPATPPTVSAPGYPARSSPSPAAAHR